MSQGVKSIHEYTQDKCEHRVEQLDPAKEAGYRYRCVKCGKHMIKLNGIVVKRLT